MQPLRTVSVCFLITLTFSRISSYKETGIELYVQGNPYVEIYRHSSINKTCRNIKEYNINLIVGIKVDNLTQWNFNKKTKSIRACPDPCDSDVQSSVALNSVNKVIEIEIELYEKQKKKERTFVVKVQGCTHFNESLNEKCPIASIKVPKNQCVLGFFVDLVDPKERPTWTDADCAVKPYIFNVVEFRYGTPKLVDIKRWTWTFLRDQQFFVAFSPCHYCNDLEGITTTSTTIKGGESRPGKSSESNLQKSTLTSHLETKVNVIYPYYPQKYRNFRSIKSNKIIFCW
ncbi:unnamed protein product [Orchesella dallaii]|uniref:Uncharacterized protein n=1 Tax=Orchesella dallaii TaxID=48710 RepID=A0ABP1QVQ1_9HEXA